MALVQETNHLKLALSRLIEQFKKDPAERSTATLTLSGTPGTIVPAGSLIKHNLSGAEFQTVAPATIGGGGSVDVGAESILYDAISANIGTLTVIQTPVAGWASVTNAAAAVLGKKNNIGQWITAYTPQIQELEDELFNLLNQRALSTAEGAQLDGLAELVGISRYTGESDADLLIRIQAQILANKSSGTIPEILTIVGLLVGLSVELEFIEYFPAEFRLVANDIVASHGEEIGNLLQFIKGGGIRGIFEWFDTSPPFSFAGNPSGAGFGVGHLASAVG